MTRRGRVYCALRIKDKMGNVESNTFVFSDKSRNDLVSGNKDICSFLTHKYSVVVSIRTLKMLF